MGRSTDTALVPFSRRGADVTRFIQYLKSQYRQDLSDKLITPVIYNDWKYYTDNAVEFKDKNNNCLYCDTIERENVTLYVVNEAQYSNGGEEWYCIFSNSELDLLRLCEDAKLDANKIKLNDIVKQTL